MIYPAPNIHVAAVGSDLIALDLATDAYLCLPDLGRHLEPAEPGEWRGDEPNIERSLIDLGLFQWGSTQPPPIMPPKPSRSTRQARGQVYSGWDQMGLLARIAPWIVRVRRRTVSTLISLSPALPVDASSADRATRQAMLFDQVLPWVPGQGQCLYRAFVLRGLLASHGIGATWVFGVRTWPFNAHCWLQIDDLLLDDDLDRVGVYTPILAVTA